MEYIVTVSVPWGGSRRYATEANDAAGATFKAAKKDNRLDAAEAHEMVLIGVRIAPEPTFPPLKPQEVRTLTNTEN